MHLKDNINSICILQAFVQMAYLSLSKNSYSCLKIQIKYPHHLKPLLAVQAELGPLCFPWCFVLPCNPALYAQCYLCHTSALLDCELIVGRTGSNSTLYPQCPVWIWDGWDVSCKCVGWHIRDYDSFMGHLLWDSFMRDTFYVISFHLVHSVWCSLQHIPFICPLYG